MNDAAPPNRLTKEKIPMARLDEVEISKHKRTTIASVLPVDPIACSAKATLDATGHDAALVQCFRNRDLLSRSGATAVLQEGPMDAAAGEEFVVTRAGEVFPGLWISGMSVCATYGGPRMGPIFGGMLLSGKRVAEAIIRDVSKTSSHESATPSPCPERSQSEEERRT